MRKPLHKRFAFWLPAVSAIVIVFNMSGSDDYNILFFFTSPPAWLVEGTGIVNSASVPFPVYYAVTLLFWLFFGWSIDWLISRISRTPPENFRRP